jgi:quinoprotein glucose dehydrogenase
VVKTDPPDPNRAAYTSGRGGSVPNVRGLPLVKPPYGRITAYDMNKGEIAWQVPNGAATPQNIKDALARLGLNDVPPTGIPSQAGLMVTRTLLFGTEGSGGRPLLHAYDKKTGENLAEVPMPASSSGVPMTYMYQGRQFVVLAVGGQPAGQIVAFALPVQGGNRGGGRGRGRGAAPGAQ